MESTSQPAQAEIIASTLDHHHFRFSNEYELHAGVAQVLTSMGLEFHKEVLLAPKNRIDFLVGRIGIEIKIDMSLAGVTRQLWRYADSDQIEAIILVTTRHAHRALPLEMKGKPIFVVYLLNL